MVCLKKRFSTKLKRKMIQTYNIKVINVGTISVSAYSLDEAREILQAYIDKKSLN